jgi:N-acetylmuramoyl-L-alanine amidase CwlA
MSVINKYEIIEKLIKFNRSYKSFQPIGIVLHETANPNDTAEMEYSYFNSGDRSASAHAFIDSNFIVQCIPWLEVGWHCCRTGNSKFIGIEMCHATDETKFQMIWDKTVWLFAYLFVNVIKCNTVTKNNLMSHAEVSEMWHESDHNDPIEYLKRYDRTVDMFRAEVQEMINKMIADSNKTIETPIAEVDQEFKENLEYLASYGKINSPQYWLEHCVPNGKVDGMYVKIILNRFAELMKNMC